jgi:hypothetical protein
MMRIKVFDKPGTLPSMMNEVFKLGSKFFYFIFPVVQQGGWAYHKGLQVAGLVSKCSSMKAPVTVLPNPISSARMPPQPVSCKKLSQ